jgi:hypothetical protein
LYCSTKFSLILFVATRSISVICTCTCSLQYYRFNEVKDDLEYDIEEMQMSVNKLKKIVELASEPITVFKIHDAMKSLEAIVEQSWLTLAEESPPLSVYWDNDQPWF